jgi:hypothetical protein
MLNSDFKIWGNGAYLISQHVQGSAPGLVSASVSNLLSNSSNIDDTTSHSFSTRLHPRSTSFLPAAQPRHPLIQDGTPQDRPSKHPADPHAPLEIPVLIQQLHNQKPILRNTNRIRLTIPNLHHPRQISRCRTCF